jgi:RNA polymerase sigma-70 factor (ECF subfamily)
VKGLLVHTKGVNNMDDLHIIELYFARDEQAVRETDRKYGKLCFRVAKNLLFNNEDSEECVNDTYLTLWNKIPPTRPINFMAYICKITRNLSLKKLEVSSAMKRSATAIISLSEIEATLPDHSIANGVNDEELGKLISSFLWNEKELDRNVFLRKYWFFDSISDIAERYSLSENNVKSMLFRTRNRLREFLRKEGIEV